MLAREARPPPCPEPPLRLLETRATVSCDYCMPDRMRMPITVCRGLAVPIREFWPKDKCWTCDRPDFVRSPRVPGASSAAASP